MSVGSHSLRGLELPLPPGCQTLCHRVDSLQTHLGKCQYQPSEMLPMHVVEQPKNPHCSKYHQIQGYIQDHVEGREVQPLGVNLVVSSTMTVFERLIGLNIVKNVIRAWSQYSQLNSPTCTLSSPECTKSVP